MISSFSGIIVAMVTPMTDDQQISYERTAKLLDKLLKEELEGIFILGTNGEAYVLSEQEKLSFTKYVIEYVNGRTKVLVGTGLNGTKETIIFSKKIAKLKPDAITLVAPAFVAPTQTELLAHFAAIIDAVDIPVLLYNMPSKTGINIDPKTMVSLAKHENLIGIKDSSGNWNNFQGYLDNRPNQMFSIIMGSDGRILESLKRGGNAAIASTANLLTANNVKLYQAFKLGNLETAQIYQNNIEPLREILHGATVPVALKAVVSASGINVGPARLPAQMPEPNSKLMLMIADLITDYQNRKII